MYSVRGFRSLTNVDDIPVSTPTILAGPNDGGKTAALNALAFLLGEYSPTEDDRSYLPEEPGSRCTTTEVRGRFRLDEWEQETFGLPGEVDLRRVLIEALEPRYEIWAPIPDDEELRNLGSLLAPKLKELAAKFGVRVLNPTKPKLLAALRTYAAEHSSTSGWAELPPGIDARLPRLASFEGHTLEPEAAVKSALALRFKAYIADETVRGQVRELEVDAQDWLRIQAKPLADHIVKRCPDISSVNVEPQVSFAPTLKSTSLHLERSSGERVRLDRSGLGSSRRISMAMWEATSELLSEQNPVEADLDDSPPPVQIIVVYDEPDTHLDYHYQREVMRLIREQAGVPHVSVVVATHSMNLIDGVDIRDVVLLRLDDHRRTMMQRLGSGEHADFDRHLGLIAAAVGLRNSVLLHERCFFAVEGDTEQQAIPILFTLSEGMSLQAAGVALWACGGNDGALNLARYLHEHGRSVLLMVDADSQTQKMFSTANLRRTFGANHDKVVAMVGKQQGVAELEELFDDETWARTANETWPRTGGWTPEHFTALRGGKKFSDQVRDLLREHSENAPAGKPAILLGLAVRLKHPTDVPEALRDVFRTLRRLAS